MTLLHKKYYNWEMNNISAIVEVFDDQGQIVVYVNGKDKSHVKQEIFNTINWFPEDKYHWKGLKS